MQIIITKWFTLKIPFTFVKSSVSLCSQQQLHFLFHEHIKNETAKAKTMGSVYVLGFFFFQKVKISSCFIRVLSFSKKNLVKN